MPGAALAIKALSCAALVPREALATISTLVEHRVWQGLHASDMGGDYEVCSIHARYQLCVYRA